MTLADFRETGRLGCAQLLHDVRPEPARAAAARARQRQARRAPVRCADLPTSLHEVTALGELRERLRRAIAQRGVRDWRLNCATRYEGWNDVRPLAAARWWGGLARCIRRPVGHRARRRAFAWRGTSRATRLPGGRATVSVCAMLAQVRDAVPAVPLAERRRYGATRRTGYRRPTRCCTSGISSAGVGWARNAASGARSGAAVFLGDGVGVMVNEEDHLRLQALRSGFALEPALAAISTAGS